MENATKSGVTLRGEFIAECFRWFDKDGKRCEGALGRFERRLMWTEKFCNIVTTEGLNRILDVMFHGTTQTASWYCGLIETDTAPAAGMNYDVPVFTESTSYDEATRPVYDEAAAAAGSTTNSASKAVFTINATKTMYGAALFSINTKGDHTGGANNVLYCYAKFTTSRAVLDDDIINLTYTVTSADDAV
jgi:hypothetical protein